MTIDEVRKISDLDLLEGIACFRGWEIQKLFDGSFEWVPPTDWHKKLSSFGPPDYPSDLNAIYDLYVWLPKEKKLVYNKYLAGLVEWTPTTLGDIYNAPARKRAEALLLMIKNGD